MLRWNRTQIILILAVFSALLFLGLYFSQASPFYNARPKDALHKYSDSAKPEDALRQLEDSFKDPLQAKIAEGVRKGLSDARRQEAGHQDGEYILRDLTKLPEVKAISGPNTTWDDPTLIQLIRNELLDPPRPHVTKLSFPLFQTPQAKAVDTILKAKKGGFFVECGALDGERSSNTIWLEQKRGWTGLLVEMDPSYYMQIRGKNRKVYSSNVCLSPQPYPAIVNFLEHKQGSGKLAKDDTIDENTLPTFCVPLYSMMLAMNRTKIDYFSLDVEGFEMPILRSIPFDKLDITVLSVEYIHGKEQTNDAQDEYVNFMASKGYKVHSKIDEIKGNIHLYVHDYVFVKKR